MPATDPTDDLLSQHWLTSREAARLLCCNRTTIAALCSHDGNGDESRPALESRRVACKKSGSSTPTRGELRISERSVRGYLLTGYRGNPETSIPVIAGALASLNREQRLAAVELCKHLLTSRREAATQLGLKAQPPPTAHTPNLL